jgi:predicted transport protein
LLVIDGDKKELPEIMETYSDTWGKMVKLILIKKFTNFSDSIYTMHPDFENIEFADIEDEILENLEDVGYSEEYHFEGVSETVRQIYSSIKADLLGLNPNLIFNPQKHYISIRKEKNIAFFITGRKKIRLVLMQSDSETRSEITKHQIKTLTAGVQKFWNGPSSAIIIETTDNLNEVKTLMRKLVAKH